MAARGGSGHFLEWRSLLTRSPTQPFIARRIMMFRIELRLERNALIHKPRIVIQRAIAVEPDFLFIDTGSGGGHQISEHRLRCIRKAQLLLQRRAPAQIDFSRREPTRPASALRGLKHEYLGPGRPGGNRGTRPGRPAPHHKHIRR